MASHHRSVSSAAPAGGVAREKTYFEQQREELVGEIAMSFEQVLANINKLNRSLEAVIAVGNEFSSVEALWSQFENVMAKEEDDGKTAGVSGAAAAAAAAARQQGQEEDGDEQQGSKTRST